MNEAIKKEMRAIQRELDELDKDRERLDWLDKNWLSLTCRSMTLVCLRGKLREAIDEAMKYGM